MNAVTVEVTMTVLVENESDAVQVAQRWLPSQRELPLSSSDGATLTSIEMRCTSDLAVEYQKYLTRMNQLTAKADEYTSMLGEAPKVRINWGNVVAYLSVLDILSILLWIFVAYTDVPR